MGRSPEIPWDQSASLVLPWMAPGSGQARTANEGVYTAAAVVHLARAKGVEMPIAEAVHAIVEGRVSVDDAIFSLMTRPLKAED